MVGITPSQVTVIGQGFNAKSQVLIDGQPSSSTVFTDANTLQATIDPSISVAASVHQFSVQNGSQTSNALQYTVYAPTQGSLPMQATPGFFVGPTETDPSFIAAADVNGDGLADVIIPAGSQVGGIAILLGQTDGTLAPPKVISCPTPSAIAIGDVDGNGTPDIVSIAITAASTFTVNILSGDGHGNFQQPVTQQTISANYVGEAYLTDIDGDGKLDLVLGFELPNGSSSSIVWLKNTGGSFAAPITLTSNYNNNYFAIADFNIDGKPDIVYEAPGTSPTLHLLMNNGGGKFTDQLAGGLSGVVGTPNVIDFNLDGIPDLVVQVQEPTGDQLHSFKGNGDGSFTAVSVLDTAPVEQMVVGDFDHDGFPDLAGPGEANPSGMQYFFGDGQGNFVARTLVGPEGQYAAVGDFNGDGLPDVVVPDRFSFVSLSLGRRDRNFPGPLSLNPAFVTSVYTGDINGDGLPDIFVGGDPIDGFPGTVFLNQGGTSFLLAAETDPTSFMIADLTGKGVVDLLGGDNYLEIWPNNGTPEFSSSPITFSQQTSNVQVADMDGDGHADVVSACEYSQCAGQIFYGNGTYRFTPVTVTNISSPYVIGDFDGDGKLDIASGGATFLNTGNRTFQEVMANNLPAYVGELVAVGDFNGDGKDDIAFNAGYGSLIFIYYSKGDGTFYQGSVIDVGQTVGGLVAADFNGDGRPDLAVGLLPSAQACILLNSGSGQFSRSYFASGVVSIAAATADFNRDGKPDLVLGDMGLSPGTLTVFYHK